MFCGLSGLMAMGVSFCAVVSSLTLTGLLALPPPGDPAWLADPVARSGAFGAPPSEVHAAIARIVIDGRRRTSWWFRMGMRMESDRLRQQGPGLLQGPVHSCFSCAAFG